MAKQALIRNQKIKHKEENCNNQVVSFWGERKLSSVCTYIWEWVVYFIHFKISKVRSEHKYKNSCNFNISTEKLTTSFSLEMLKYSTSLHLRSNVSNILQEQQNFSFFLKGI